MAISRSFGGQTLLKPGAYSVSRVDNAQGIAVGENNTLMLIGEAGDGVPGGEENSRVFTNVQNLVDYYVSGDIVDAALAASRPSLTPGISAPTNFITYKTNASLAAVNSFLFTAGPGPLVNFFDVGDIIAFDVTFPINASGETYTENFSHTVVTAITSAATAAVVLETALAANSNINSAFLPSSIVSVGAEATVLTARKNGPQFGTDPGSTSGDRVTVNPAGKVIITTPVITRAGTTADGVITPSFEVRTQAILDALGDTTVVQLNAAFTDAFNFDPNVIIPLWSNDATSVNDPFQPSVTIDFIDYQIAGAALQSHLIARSGVAVRKEAQGFIGARDADWNTTITNLDAAAINSFLVQACIQDVRVIDSLGALSWKGPHIFAAILAGIRLGSTVGEPLTFKTLNANGVGHNINPMTGMPNAALTQFRPGFDFNTAINAGLTFSELAAGGNRVVVDNTRYAIDESFVFNRGSVIEAAQFVARTSRNILEGIFVGQKVSNGAALSLKNVLRNYLIQLNTDNIITSSSDAPFGFVEETFTVSINGNTASIQVEVKPVQGLDFIFIDFTLGNITQSA